MFIKNTKKKKGFTLVELVAVIAMIAILAMAFIPKVSGYITEAKKVAVIDQAKKVVTAYETISLKSSSVSVTKVSDVVRLSNGLLTMNDLDKLYEDTAVATCRNILNTELYTFKINLDDGKLTPGSVKLYSELP